MKINILDAGIRHRAGHHFDYSLKIARNYAAAGHDVHVYGFTRMKDEVAPSFEPFAKVTALFSTFPYHQPGEYDWYAGELVRLRNESSRIADELKSVRQADVWIWPTIRPSEIEACAMLGVTTPMVGCVHWDPGVESSSMDAQIWRYVLLFAKTAGVALTLVSPEPELRHRFLRVVPDGRFAVVPQPVDGPPIAKPKTALKRIGFFGHQREEKGGRMMPSLLTRLVEDGYSITFHNSDPNYPFPDVPGIDRLDYVDDLAVPIAECDLVVLPYDVQRYQARGSGILTECLALGVPVTAPIGTLAGRVIEQAGVGPVFRVSQVGPIYSAIKTAERNYAIFSSNAHRHAANFCNRNGVERFASAMLAAATPGVS